MQTNLLIIGCMIPEPQTNAAGIRMMQLISLFLKQGWKITFASTAEKTPYSEDLASLGIVEEKILLNDSAFDEFLKKLNPSVVLFDRFMMEEQFGWRVAESCPNALRILDTEDLHFLRKSGEENLKKKEEENNLISEITKREIASIYRCDISLIISETEIQLLQNQFKVDSALLHYLPFLMETPTKDRIEALPKFEERNGFIFIGNFRHNPNVDAVIYLKETIWSNISKQLPEAQLHIYGAYLPEKIRKLHNLNETFLIHGWAENAGEVIQKSRVMLSPLRFGAGLKGKLIDAMQYGTPSVTTSIGAEGISHETNWNGFVENNPQEFFEKAVLLYTDASLWQNSQTTGFEILKNCFSVEKFEEAFFIKIQNTANSLENHRRQNFIGAMLQHHTLQSTKYMSKWIEEKNRSSE